MNDVVGLVAGTGFASGLSLYATTLLLGLAGRVLDVAVVPESLTGTPVLVVLAALTAVEFVADKVPWLDTAWDAIHTIVRPVGAAALGVALVDGQQLFGEVLAEGAEVAATDGNGVAGGLLAAVLAAIAHGGKAAARVAVNTSPEPLSNGVVSLVEDGLVGVLVWVAVAYPTVALVVVGVLTAVSMLVVVGLWRLLRRAIGRLRARREAAP